MNTDVEKPLYNATFNDHFLGEFEIALDNGQDVVIRSRDVDIDMDGTDLLSFDDPGAPVYLAITGTEWTDDPSEPDPKQGTRSYYLMLKNNTDLNIYDPWLIFINLGEKEYTNPDGFTSRAFIDPEKPNYASRPYVSFANDDGIILAHSSANVVCDLFMPKEVDKKLLPITFVAYGSWPGDYYDVGEGHPDIDGFREVYDMEGGRGVVGSATAAVEDAAYFGWVQHFRMDGSPNGALRRGPDDAPVVYLPQDWEVDFASRSDVGWPLDAIIYDPLALWPPENTPFKYMQIFHPEHDNGWILEHSSGDYEGQFIVINGPIFDIWLTVEALLSQIGLPIGDAEYLGPEGNSAQDSVQQSFENGVISVITDGPCAGQALMLTGGTAQSWINSGGKSGSMGLPLGGMMYAAPSGGGGWIGGEPSMYQAVFVPFEFGRLYITVDADDPEFPVYIPFFVHSEIWEAYREFDPAYSGQFCDQYELVPEASFMGLPSSDEDGPYYGIDEVEGHYQSFEGGLLINYPAAPFGPDETVAIWGPIYTYWNDAGMNESAYGWPVAEAVEDGGTGYCSQEFQGGVIYWNPENGAVWDDSGYELDFQLPVAYPDATGYHISQEWMYYMPPYGYHLADDWDGDGDPYGDYGDPVYASEAGRVLFAEDIGGTWGQVMIIQHDNVPGIGTVSSVYAHCSAIDVELGEIVDAGQKIGEIGDANGTLQPHLHFEIRLGNDITMDKAHSPALVSQGPQGQVDPTEFVNTH